MFGEICSLPEIPWSWSRDRDSSNMWVFLKPRGTWGARFHHRPSCKKNPNDIWSNLGILRWRWPESVSYSFRRWIFLVGGLEHEFHVPTYWECHHPNWRTHIFQRVWNHQPVKDYIRSTPEQLHAYISSFYVSWQKAQRFWTHIQMLTCNLMVSFQTETKLGR